MITPCPTPPWLLPIAPQAHARLVHASDNPARPGPALLAIDLGRMDYHTASAVQEAALIDRLARRDSPQDPTLLPATLLLVEHDPVITISRRPGVAQHLLAHPATLAARGVTTAATDRGGDITYHGPGQVVAYPIADLNLLRLRLHDFVRLLEAAVIDLCQPLALRAVRDPGATGVWIAPHGPEPSPLRKVAAIGIRVRRWVSTHGLALNVSTDLDHFALIVPCGLLGRPVTSLARELGPACPTTAQAKDALAAALAARFAAALLPSPTAEGPASPDRADSAQAGPAPAAPARAAPDRAAAVPAGPRAAAPPAPRTAPPAAP